MGRQIGQYIKSHPDPGQRFAWKVATQLIGIDHRFGLWCRLGRQMMVGNDHLHAVILGLFDSVMTGNAIIHGNQ